jgi:hypothetical protein
MNVCYPAEKSCLRHHFSSRGLFLGDFRPGCLLYLLIVFFFMKKSRK